MSRRLLILAEASEKIGTGHVVESFQLCREALQRSLEVAFLVNAECPAELLRHSPMRPEIAQDFSAPEIVRTIGRLGGFAGCVTLTNLRCVTNQQLAALASFSSRIGCIDEWGKRQIECDVVFNNTIVDRYHHYTSSKPNFRIFKGPTFMALGSEFQHLNQKTRHDRDSIRRVVMAMGGMDPNSVTCSLLESILPNHPEVEVDVVLGVGFKDFDRLNRIVSDEPGPRVRINQNLKSLASLLFEADVGFTIGGNTLCELACVGTPALTLYEDDHELDQAEAFERGGFGYCLGSVRSASSEKAIQGLLRMQDQGVRQRHSETGRRLVDGRGTERIIDILVED